MSTAQRHSLSVSKRSRAPAHFLGAHFSEVNKLIKISPPIPNQHNETHVWSCSFDKTIIVWSSNVPILIKKPFRFDGNLNTVIIGLSRPRCRQDLYGHKGSADILLRCDPGIVCSCSTSTRDKSLHLWQYHTSNITKLDSQSQSSSFTQSQPTSLHNV